MVRDQLAHRRAARTSRAAHRARPRGRPHPVRPRAVLDRADDPARRHAAAGADADASPGCRCWRSSSRCSSGSAPPSSPATARRRSSTATRSTTCRTLMVLAGGTASRKLDLDAFVRQAAEYEEWEPGWDKLAPLRASSSARRTRSRSGACSELMKWVRSRRVRPDRRRRVPHAAATRVDARDEAGDARRVLRRALPRRSSARPARASARPATRRPTPPTSSADWLRSGRD